MTNHDGPQGNPGRSPGESCMGKKHQDPEVVERYRAHKAPHRAHAFVVVPRQPASSSQ
jgi:hypothetical protein